MKTVSVIPTTPAATAISPQNIADSQNNIENLKANGASQQEIKAAEEEHQRLCNAQVEQLRQIYFQRNRL